MASRVPIMAMTTKSSIRVTPRLDFILSFPIGHTVESLTGRVGVYVIDIGAFLRLVVVTLVAAFSPGLRCRGVAVRVERIARQAAQKKNLLLLVGIGSV